MNNSSIILSRPLAWLCVFFLLSSVGATSVLAADPKLEVLLIWGTHGETSPDEKHKPLDEDLVKKLKMFKWKKYFTVNRLEVTPNSRSSQKIRLSPHSEVAVKALDGSRYEINVYGKGKHVRKITEKITKQDSLVIAGDDKNDCAWFILIREN